MSAPHIHLDPLGGIAGDMFAAAMLDAFPALEAEALRLAEALAGALGASATGITLDRAPVGGFAGARLVVDAPSEPVHRGLRDLVGAFEATERMTRGAREHARAIAHRLAEAEAAVHGIDVERVHFHEVGAVDSAIDMALAGHLVDAVGASGWSVGPLPLGGGTVRAAHGVLPVPAPATALLMRGFAVHDDGLAGERVTPTGMAILAHLRDMMAERPAGVLRATGTGHGTRSLPDRPNALRALVIEPSPEAATGPTGARVEPIAALGFEIDDQTGEDLATGLDAVRAVPGVLDATHMPAMGKKGRMVAAVRVLCRPDAVDVACRAIFEQTTTLGVRESTLRRHVLAREAGRVEGVRVKRAARPGGATIKPEADDIAHGAATHAGREALRDRVRAADAATAAGQGRHDDGRHDDGRHDDGRHDDGRDGGASGSGSHG